MRFYNFHIETVFCISITGSYIFFLNFKRLYWPCWLIFWRSLFLSAGAGTQGVVRTRQVALPLFISQSHVFYKTLSGYWPRFYGTCVGNCSYLLRVSLFQVFYRSRGIGLINNNSAIFGRFSVLSIFYKSGGYDLNLLANLFSPGFLSILSRNLET